MRLLGRNEGYGQTSESIPTETAFHHIAVARSAFTGEIVPNES